MTSIPVSTDHRPVQGLQALPPFLFCDHSDARSYFYRQITWNQNRTEEQACFLQGILSLAGPFKTHLPGRGVLWAVKESTVNVFLPCLVSGEGWATLTAAFLQLLAPHPGGVERYSQHQQTVGGGPGGGAMPIVATMPPPVSLRTLRGSAGPAARGRSHTGASCRGAAMMTSSSTWASAPPTSQSTPPPPCRQRMLHAMPPALPLPAQRTAGWAIHSSHRRRGRGHVLTLWLLVEVTAAAVSRPAAATGRTT